MTNEDMEYILYNTGKQMPMPAKAAPQLPLRQNRRLRLSRAAVALIIVLLCSVTVYAATAEVQIYNASGYGQWTGFPVSPEKYGMELDNAYGAFILSDQYEMWVVPHGVTYLEALFDGTYRAGNFDYRNYSNGVRTEGWGDVWITAGKTDHPYWRTYFCLDENDVPNTLHDLTAQIYRDYTLYCGEYRSEDSESTWISVKWVDYSGGYVYSFSFHGSLGNREDALEFTKMLIDGMR